MEHPNSTFGQQAVDAASASALLALEARAHKGEQFAPLDALIGALVSRSLRGERIASLVREDSTALLVLPGLSAEQSALIDAHFSMAHQQARGAWFLPKDASLTVGWLNLPCYFRQYPRYAMGLAEEEQGRVALQASGAVVMVWAILQPFFAQLLRPLALRGGQSGTLEQEQQVKAWKEVDTFLEALNVNVSQALARMCYGSGWSRLRAPEQVQVKVALCDALAREVTPVQAALYRAYQLQALLARYYQRAKKGPPTRRQVITKPLQSTLAGYFGGDWLAFLHYIAEEPHPEERIVTALPAPQIYVGTATRAAEVAATHGLPLEEVQRMLATYWGEKQVVSPVEQRVDVLRRFWQAFDEIHARQRSGMQPLWGLVEDAGFVLRDEETSSRPYQPGLYRQLLSADVLSQIAQLWGTVMLPQWPHRIVSEPGSHRLMAETFGPALRFWHGCALTAWFICEGPSSRTDLSGLATYYRRELAELNRLGCPVDPSLFADLIAAEKLLGPSEPITTTVSQDELIDGITLTFQMNTGSRRDGFETLRDIITRHRRAWSTTYLEQYLRVRWETALYNTATEHSRLLEEQGRPPTLKQFAKTAQAATNHWFGGDIGGLYTAIGERAPERPQHVRVMPDDPVGFAWAVFRALGGQPFSRQVFVSSQAAADAQTTEAQRHGNLLRLGELSVWYVQLEEALGRPPRLREFGHAKFAWSSAALTADIEHAWTMYQEAIAAAKRAVVTDSPSLQSELSERGEQSQSASEPAPIPVSATKNRPFWRRLFEFMRRDHT